MKNTCAISGMMAILILFGFGLSYLYDLTVQRIANKKHSAEIQKVIVKVDSIIFELEAQKLYLYKIDTIIN